MIRRRSFLTLLGAAAFAPAIVRADSLMPISVERVRYADLIERLQRDPEYAKTFFDTVKLACEFWSWRTA